MPGPSSMNRPLLLGHRGSRALKSIPENTLASFDQAIADGCDGFEFDVRLTRDGCAVVCHGPLFEGITIASSTAQQLAKMPRLQDVLTRYQNRAFLDIELKVSSLEGITSALLRKLPPRRGYVVSSFLPEVLQALNRQDSGIPLGLICETRTELRAWNQLPIQYVIPHRKLIDADLLSEWKAAGKRVLVWTVNASADMKRFAESDVDGIISDKTSLLCRTLAV